MKMLIVGFVIATLSKVLADEMKEWMAWLPAKLIRWAARHLPESERYEEEWLSHCNDLPGNFAKLWHALGCVIVYVRYTKGMEQVAWWALIYPLMETAWLFVFSMCIIIETAGIASVHDADPEFVRLRRLREKAGGIRILGINQLDVLAEDYAPRKAAEERQRAFRENAFHAATSKLLAPDVCGDYYESRYRLLCKAINWLCWK